MPSGTSFRSTNARQAIASSRNAVSLRPSPLKVTRQTGRLDASNLKTTGGNVPGGRRLSCAMAKLEIVVTAESGFVPG